MLLRRLEILKATLAFRRLYLSEAHEKSKSFFFKQGFQFQIGKISLLESKIVWLQQRLSIALSIMCSCLVEWDSLPDRSDFQREISTIISEIRLSESLKKHSIPSLANYDPDILGYLHGRLTAFAWYNGFSIHQGALNFPIQEIEQSISIIQAVDVNDSDSLNKAINEIGKLDAYDWKNAMSWKFSRGRLN